MSSVNVRRIIRNARKKTSVSPGEDCQKFRRGAYLTVLVNVVGLGIAKDPAESVHRAVGRPHRDFGNPVPVEVEHDEIIVMRPRPNVLPRRESPQAAAAVDVVSVIEHRRRAPEVRIVPAARIPLDDQLEFPVTVKIADGTVVGLVRKRCAVRLVRVLPCGRRLDLERNIADRRVRGHSPSARGIARLPAAQHRPYGIRRALRRVEASILQKRRAGERFGIEARPVAVDVEGEVRRVLPSVPPRHNRLALSAPERDHAAP